MKDQVDIEISIFSDVMKKAEQLLGEVYGTVTSEHPTPEQISLTIGDRGVLRFCTSAPYRSIRVYNSQSTRVYCLPRHGRFYSEWSANSIVAAVGRIFAQKRGVPKVVKETHSKWPEEKTAKIIAATLTGSRMETEAPYKYLCEASELAQGVKLMPDIDNPGGLLLSIHLDLKCSEERAKRIGQLLFYALLDVTPGTVPVTTSQYGCKH